MKLRNEISSIRGYSLMELLVVAAILSVIGGGIIIAYDNLIAQASKSGASKTISGLMNSIRTYNELEKRMPDNVESLIAAHPKNPYGGNRAFQARWIEGENDSFCVSFLDDEAPTKASFLKEKLKNRIEVLELTDNMIDNLVSAGFTKIRYLDKLGDDDVVSRLNVKPWKGKGGSADTGKMSEIDIPSHAFSPPLGRKENRGRGFYVDLDHSLFDNSDPIEFAVWKGSGISQVIDDDDANRLALYDNVKVGAHPKAVLVCLGIGPQCTLVTGSDQLDPVQGINGNMTKTGSRISHRSVATTCIQSAPYQAGGVRNKYGHYIMLVDVTQSPAMVVTVVDSEGNFLDEVYSESS